MDDFLGIKVRVNPAIPPGEVWLVSGCARTKDHPEIAHGEPEWRMAAMCVHEHLERALVCSACKENLESWVRTKMAFPAPWCARCYRMRPGGHHCTMTPKFTRLQPGPA